MYNEREKKEEEKKKETDNKRIKSSTQLQIDLAPAEKKTKKKNMARDRLSLIK